MRAGLVVNIGAQQLCEVIDRVGRITDAELLAAAAEARMGTCRE